MKSSASNGNEETLLARAYLDYPSGSPGLSNEVRQKLHAQTRAEQPLDRRAGFAGR